MLKTSLFAASAVAAVILSAPDAQARSGDYPQGSYLEECRNVQVDPFWVQDPQVYAECPDNRGRWRSTALNYRGCRGDIVNDNGRLACRSGYDRPDWDDDDDHGRRGYRLPRGSWREYCVDGDVDGSVFSARCPDRYGRYRTESIDLRQCHGGPVGYARGDLFCEEGGPSYPRPPQRRGSITLYDYYDYRGSNVRIEGDRPNLDGLFNDRADSVQITGGVWQLCTDSHYRGSCVTIDGSQNLPSKVRGRVSSVRRLD
ncbi:MAG: hypothetical protein HXY22_12100 [Alphaproteobacteria bacterium]|nr:hypothetical protein [Alphaproteobacteria bacterium]